jgi:hypothetical protein
MAGSLLDETITTRNAMGKTAPVPFAYANEYLFSFDERKQERGRLSYHADLLHHRHALKGDQQPEDGPLSDLLDFDTFIHADYYLYLRGAVTNPGKIGFTWLPWTAVFGGGVPPYIARAARTKVAEQIALALGSPDIPTLKERMKSALWQLGQLWGHLWDSPIRFEDIERIGTL